MKKALLLSALSGLMLGLAFPLAVYSNDLFENLPNGILVFFALVPLFYAIDRLPNSSFLVGFVSGFTFYSVALFWIIVAMILFGDISVIKSTAILLTLVIYMSIYFGLFAMIIKKTKKLMPLVLLAPCTMVALEIARNYFLTGFPWANLGYAAVDFGNLVQISDLGGVYLVTFLIVFVNSAVYELAGYASGKRPYPLVPSALCIFLILASIIYGAYRIRSIENAAAISSLRTALVQGNIPQDQKWSADYGKGIVDKYLALSKSAMDIKPDLIVWPEASLPYSVSLNVDTIEPLAQGSIPSKYLIGAISYEHVNRVRKAYNSAFYVSPGGKLIDYYHKTHLVPFSEHVIYEKYFPILRKVLPPMAGDFAKGESFKLMRLNTNNFGVLICFEAIFPEIARRFVKDGADFLVNITNDAWFGRTSGPYQHYEITKFRAIENRVPILRAANTGISAVILPTGKELYTTSLFKDAVIRHDVKIKKSFSLYSRIGDTFAYACALLTFLILTMSFRIKKSEDRRFR